VLPWSEPTPTDPSVNVAVKKLPVYWRATRK